MNQPVDRLDRDLACICGMPVDVIDSAQAEARLLDAIGHGRRCFVSTPNLNFLAACSRDARFRQSLVESDLSLADGTPLVWLGRLLGVPLPERVAGSTLFETMSRGSGVGGRRIKVFFFAGREGVAASACAALNASSTGMECVGYHCPGFGTVEEMSSAETIERINASGAEFLVVSLGAAKGQSWIMRNRDRLRAPVISHLGAVVDFVAGEVQRAPQSWQLLGLEWLWRIKEDPALWRRYWGDACTVAGLVLTQVVPYRLRSWRRRAAPKAPEARLVRARDGAVIHLSGSMVDGSIAAVRPVFLRALALQRDITLDMGGVEWLDAAFLGFILQFEGSCRVPGRRVGISSAGPALRTTLRQCGLAYLLGQGDRVEAGPGPEYASGYADAALKESAGP